MVRIPRGMPMPNMMTEIQDKIRAIILVSLDAWRMPITIIADKSTPYAFSMFLANGTLVIDARPSTRLIAIKTIFAQVATFRGVGRSLIRSITFFFLIGWSVCFLFIPFDFVGGGGVFGSIV